MKRIIFLFLLSTTFLAHAQAPDTVKTPKLPANGLDPDAGSSAGAFVAVQEPPKFPGGLDSLGRYLSANLVYPLDLVQARVGGVVLVSFVVEADGSLSQIKIRHSPDEQITWALIKVFQGLRYTPGQQNGHAVSAAFSTTVKFDWRKPRKFE